LLADVFKIKRFSLRSPPLPHFPFGQFAMPSKVQLFVAQLPQLLPSDWASDAPTLAIVIDTLRFTSTACLALQAGAKSISVAAQVDAARQLANSLGPDTLLCGERHCHRIEGFQLGNSPLEYTRETVQGRDLVFSTTNGTLAVAAAVAAHQMILAGLVNRAAVVDWIRDSQMEKVWIVCAGTDGQIAAEDVLTAGAIVSICQQDPRCSLANDSALIASHYFQSQPTDRSLLTSAMTTLLSQAAGGKNLIPAGYSHDIAAVSQIDSINTVPRNCADSPMRFHA